MKGRIMNKVFCFLILLCITLYAKPMESIERYNIILVHGAADSLSGMYCEAPDLEEAYSYYDTTAKNVEDVFGRTKSYYDVSWDPDLRFWKTDSFDLTKMDTSRSNATGMIKTLPDWINDKILDGERKDRFGIYLNRPFLNPANTPIVNGGEIGNRTWKGRDGCSVRRSLTEEAEEMRNWGRETLAERRSDDSLSYRKYKSDVGFYTHRNILISHSMGGLASREYVQSDYYNGDVDKVITLDSPHKGTYSLDGFLDMSHYVANPFIESVLQQTILFGTAAIVLQSDPTVDNLSLLSLSFGMLGVNALNGVIQGITGAVLGYGFKEQDPLVNYIRPGSNDLSVLNDKEWNDKLPMFRVLYGVGGLTFGSNKEYGQNYASIVIPDALYAMVKNIVAQVSHDEIDNPAYWNNIVASGVLGLVGGLSLTDQGSILIPHWSGAGEGVAVFDDNPQADVVKVPFAANENVSESYVQGISIFATAVTALVAANALDLLYPGLAKPTRMAIGLSTAAILSAYMLPPTVTAIMDMTENHENPSQADWQEKQKSKKNSYSKISGGSETVESYLLEDFLYEKPFVNLAVYNDNDWTETVDSTKMDSLGLYGAEGSLSVKTMQDTRKSPLKFLSSSDWEKVGVKVERWERIDGLDTSGTKVAKNSVPIRHVERYNVPAITVDNWIEKYSFVVDDLMPHRLRQIRMNFNYQEEIAWECDITKPETSSTACTVYKRSGGGDWNLAESIGNKGYVPHPVKKNGQFDFEPGKYGIGNLLAIQKDNQNTVTVSTVNKIGLSNTQRFYYLYKATDNKLNEVWPRRDIVLNKITGFKAFASALGYQGFHVANASDTFLKLSGDSLGSVYSKSEMDMELDTYYDLSRIGTTGVAADGLVYDSTSAYFTSRQSDSIPAEGDYVWQFFANIVNTADSAVDTNSYEIPFRIDRTAPVFAVTPEYDFMNPLKTAFVARYAWADSLHEPDIRAMRWTLEGGCTVPAGSAASAAVCTNSHEMRAFYNVAANEFAMPWDSASRAFTKNHGDGLYRVKAFAVDAAVSDSATYMKMANLVDEIARDPSNVNASLWPTVADSLNATTEYATFVVDVTAPKLENVVAGADSGAYSSYASLARPARNSQYGYATYDSLLKISYKVTEPLIGRDSTAVTVLWNFVHLGDTSKVDRAGDSVWVKSTGSATAEWREAASMRLEDGDYEIRALASDAAKNDTLYRNLAKVRIDKTAPTIFGLTSDRLVYPDSVTEFSATIKVNENNDVATNRTGMRCYYRVTDGTNSMNWKAVSNNVLGNDSVTFEMDSVGTKHGLRYLEAACVDAAGNVSLKTDIFYVGTRTPMISSPVNGDPISANLVAIAGIAPPSGNADSVHTIYRLRYKVAGDTVWETSNIFVNSSVQNDSLANVSKVSQSNDGVLGYINRELPNGSLLSGSYVIELGTFSAAESLMGVDSLWTTDTTEVFFGFDVDTTSDAYLRFNIVMDKDSIKAGKDSLNLSAFLSGTFDGNYFMRIYAEDAKGVGVFEATSSKVLKNPYYGLPSDTLSDTSAVWFYEDNGVYHLQWNGLAAGDSLKIRYNSSSFNKICASADSTKSLDKCVVRAAETPEIFDALASLSYADGFPELSTVGHTDSEMLVTGKSGHLVMRANGAFAVSRTAILDTLASQMRVYFGSSAKDGFYWVANGISGDTLSPLATGWSVNPEMYGLKYKWDGLLSTGGYPAEGLMKIYAEAFENTSSNPHVFIDSAVVKIKLDPVEIALASKLPDFVALKKDDSFACDGSDSASCEYVNFALQQMTVSFGIKNRESKVEVYVMKNGKKVATLLDSASVLRAHSSDSAYKVIWNSKNMYDVAELEEGSYQIKIVATPVDGSASATKTASFSVKFAETMQDLSPDNPKDLNNDAPSIYVSEAFADANYPGVFRYEPTADYLIDADIEGHRLPAKYENGVALSGTVSGKQMVYGYEPKRFNLAIRRHRKELKLIIMAKLDVATVYANCNGEGVHEDENERIFYYLQNLTFNEMNRMKSFNIDKHIGKIGSGRGLSGTRYNKLSLYAFLDNQVNSFEEKNGEENIPIDTNKVVPVWSKTFSLPLQTDDNRFSKDTIQFNVDPNVDVGCLVYGDSTTCVHGPSDDLNNTSGYNPNKKLFNVFLIPVEGVFYTDKGEVHNDCYFNDAIRNERIKFELSLKIPDSYWNSDFGMDNLVNRTIRFDHTNKTIYSKTASDTNGYWTALLNQNLVMHGTYFDGTIWHKDKTYGLLTPFEVQYLPMFPATTSIGGDYFDDGTNTFLFADEDRSHPQDARFDLHFYGDKNEDDYFQVLALGAVASGESTVACESDSTKNIVLVAQNDYLCQVSALSTDDSVKNTPFFDKNSKAHFYVGRNKKWSTVLHGDSIDYPAAANWRENLKDSCKASEQDWDFATNGENPCYKYYDVASKVHYSYGDYQDTAWLHKFTNGDSVLKNYVNSPKYVYSNPLGYVEAGLAVDSLKGSNKFTLYVEPDSNDYDAKSQRFFVKLDSVEAVNTALKTLYGNVNASVCSLALAKEDSAYVLISPSKDSLYIKAIAFDSSIVYRKSEDSLAKSLARPGKDVIPVSRLYRSGSAWEKGIAVKSANLMQLDSSEHSHLKLTGTFPDSSDIYVEFKSADSILDKRVKEFVELRAYLKAGTNYQLSYLNDSAFYSVPNDMLDSPWRDSIYVKKSGNYRLGWFNVNKLQGNTQFMLTWGGSKNAYNFSKFDMVVGSDVTPSGSRTVKSPLEEVEVTFPTNALTEKKDVTVRISNPKDHAFDVFNNLALNGPIVEVRPSMTFGNNDALPRIQMKISRDEMNAMHTTSETIKLYKVDFDNKEFVPLENALYGYLDANGAPLGTLGNDTAAVCSTAVDTRCGGASSAWAYLLISAETRTFSVFTAMDSAVAEVPNFDLEILPEVATSADRIIDVKGISKFNLYVDDDSLWNDNGDSTAKTKLAYALDSAGFAHVTLPVRGYDIDTSYVFVVAVSVDSAGKASELPAAPVFGRALTVNTVFACSVPEDSLWLGLDNGYMAYGATCTHPGSGTVALYRDGKLVTEIRGEIPDSIMYDGSKTSGASRMGKIPSGVYESRYVGVSALGMDMQMAGPLVYTDSMRPTVENFDVVDSADILDRIFVINANVYDSESGVASVVVLPVFGSDTLRTVSAVPDSIGNVKIPVRLSRKRLNDCVGCKLALNFHAEDYGHNHADVHYVSNKLYPYPAELALWYPSYEGAGDVAHEYLGSGHDLNLAGVFAPWLSDVGLYFNKPTDVASGEDVVHLGEAPAYSFEARVKLGNTQAQNWHRILGFNGSAGLNIEVQVKNRDVRIVEGSAAWLAEGILPKAKEWFHLVTTVDSIAAKFYVNGTLAKSVPVNGSFAGLDRELDGTFSVGALPANSFVGNVADIRMYREALTAEQVATLVTPIADDEDVVPEAVVIAVDDMETQNGFERLFSCSVAGNHYLVSNDSGASLKAFAYVENSGDFNIVVYARSASLNSAIVSAGENSATLRGTMNVSNVWRPVTISGIALSLKSGLHEIALKVPSGIQIGGIALVTPAYPESAIAWGKSGYTSNSVAYDGAKKVKTYLHYEGYPETSTLRPRIRLKNVSGEPVNGFSVRYYFRGEDASQALVERYWPNNVSTFPAVHSESANTGYVEWKFTETIPVAGTVFSGDGPHFGLYNSDYTPWNAFDDPSYVGAESGVAVDGDGFFEDAGIIVLDGDENLIGGSCTEMEDPISLEAKARVLAADVRNDNQASEIHVKVENTGNVALKNFDVRYYFFVEEGFAPVHDIYDTSACSSVTMESLGFGRWQVNVHCNKSLAPGKAWKDPVKFVLHMPGWVSLWNASDDPSHDSLETSMREIRGICVFDSTGVLVYGDSPDWVLPASEEINSDSLYKVDFGYHATDNSIPVVRTPDGLILTLANWTYVELSLVTANGIPVKSIFNGTLAPGEQLVRVDWTGVDMNKTFLMLKVDGSIKSTKKLSLI